MGTSGRSARVATLLLLCIAAPATAQRTAGDDESVANSAAPSTPGSLGSFLGSGVGALVKGLSIEARVRTLYESNIQRVGDGIQLQPGRDKSDFRISPSVIATNVIALGRQQFYVSGEYGRDFYVRNSELNRNRHALGAGLNARVGNFCTGALNARHQRRQSLLSEASIQGDNVIETTAFSASANCQRAVGIGFGVSASHDERDNKSVARNLFDSKTTSFGGNLSYSLPVLGQLTLGGTYAMTDYPSRDVIVADGGVPTLAGDGVDIYSGNLGYRRNIGPRLTVNLGGSYYVAKPDPRNVLVFPPFFFPVRRDDFSGAGYQFGLAYRPSPRLTADLRAARDISQSSNVGALFVIRDSFGADVGYTLGPSITTGLGASYDIRRYRNAFASTDEPFPRVRDAIGRVYARVTYAPRRLYDLDFEVGHQRRSSNPSIYDYNSTSAALTLRVKFGRG